jgi:hypothetical protein
MFVGERLLMGGRIIDIDTDDYVGALKIIIIDDNNLTVPESYLKLEAQVNTIFPISNEQAMIG